MKKIDRFVRTLLGFVAGMFFCNFLWIMGSTATWGGGWNVFGCFLFPTIALALWWISMHSKDVEP